MDDQGGQNIGTRIISYLMAGLLFYGGLGWVGDRYFETAWMLPTGLIVGAVAAMYIVIKRYGNLS